MRLRALCYIIALIVIIPAARATAAERVLLEWDFTKASDTLGWSPAEPLERCRVTGGSLQVAPGPGIPKLESPLFEIEAKPWQFVEIEMSSDTGGTGLVYYSNTTEEPYHGFRTGQFAKFAAAGGRGFRTYRVHPFWHRLGKITHIRVDPPGKDVEIRAVRITERASPAGSKTFSWDFRGSDRDWWMVNDGTKPLSTNTGIQITGNRDAVFVSPPLELDSSDRLWATLRFASQTERAVMFRWVSDEGDALQSAPVWAIGDGQMHGYSIDLAAASGWTGKIFAVGITPTDAEETESIILQSVTLANQTTGPPEVRIKYFGPEPPYVRLGDNVRLVLDACNLGGAPAKETAATVTLPTETGSKTLPNRRVALLKPGETRRFVWEVKADKEGEQTAAARVDCVGSDGIQESIRFRVHPKLDAAAKASKYVPEPKPADTGDCLVGCYYYPGWNTYERWAVLNDYPERRPLLGYYREGDPEVADWHVKWALDHGISFFIYDWYWDRGTRQLEHALHEGLFKSRYGDKMKFCLLWANHNPDGSSSAEDNEAVTRYWIANYFSRPNYLKIDAKNVVVIFSTYRLTKDMGSEAVRKSFDKMRKLCEESGVGGLYLVGCTYPGADRIKLLEVEGYDALSGYNYPSAGLKGRKIAPYAWMVDGYREWWCEIADASSLPYIPVCEPGWDARPWHGLNSIVRTGKSPALWKLMLENAKAFVDDPKRKKPCGKKIVFLEAWNEWGEGDYIEPHAQYVFDYLEAIRAVFAPKSNRPVLVVPQDIGLGPYDVPPTEPKTEWDFSKPEDRTWHAGNMANVGYESGSLTATAANRDPILYNPRVRVDASKRRTIEIKMKTDREGEGQLFFSRAHSEMSEERSVRFKVIGDGQYHVYEVDMSSNPRWRGAVEALRFDPIDVEGARIELSCIRLK